MQGQIRLLRNVVYYEIQQLDVDKLQENLRQKRLGREIRKVTDRLLYMYRQIPEIIKTGILVMKHFSKFESDASEFNENGVKTALLRTTSNDLSYNIMDCTCLKCPSFRPNAFFGQ